MTKSFVTSFLLITLALAPACSAGAPLTSTNTAPLKSNDIRSGTRYALPLRLVTIQIFEGTIDGKPKNYAVIAGTQDVPDPRFQYLLSYQGSSLSHDKLEWTVKDGFLASVKAKTKDQSLETLGSAVKLFIEMAKATMSLGGASTPGAPVTTPVLQAQYVVDPLSKHGLQKLAEIKSRHGIDITLDVRVHGVNKCDVNPEQDDCRPCGPTCISGVAYRADYPYVLSINPMATVTKVANRDVHNYLVHGEQVVLLPNRSPVTLMPLTRAAFVEQNMELTFTRGVLTKVVVDKPSQMKSFFDGLVAPVKAIASIPGELLTLRIQQNTQSVQMMQSEAALMKEMRAFIEAQRQHQARMQANGAAASAEDSGNPGLGG